MGANRTKATVLALFATVLMVSSVGAATVLLGTAPGARAAPSSTVTPVAKAPSSLPSVPSKDAEQKVRLTSTPNLGSQMAAAAIAATKVAGQKPNIVFVPHSSASAAQVAASKAAGHIVPLYNGNPDPIGLSDLGLSAGPGGAVVPSVLNTTSLEGLIAFNQTGVVPDTLFDSSPDGFTVQMNAVVTNITLFGHDHYSFWTQNVLEYFPTSALLLLVTNVWNFTGPNLSLNVFYQHGPYGTQFGTTYYGAEVEIPFPVVYPFTARLWMNSTITDGRNAVDFNVQVGSSADPSENFTAPYDYVIFNSLKSGAPALSEPSPYTANGYQYNPIGLPDDFEIDLGGPGGGSQATFFAADATLGLAYWNGTAYTSIPSAFDFGSETGETSTGASVGWNDTAAGSPGAGFGTYATMTTGPAILTGLWNASTPRGTEPVTLATTPSNAFNLVAAPASNFTDSEFAVTPEMNTNTIYLPAGTYTVETELSDYAPVVTTLTVASSPVTVSVSLTPNSVFGIYTPLWAFSNAQIAALSTSGNGLPATPYVIENNQYGAIGSAFGLYNDYGFPAYPAVFFSGTTASAEFLDPPSFSTGTNTQQFPGPSLPAVNDLQYWFQGVQNVSVVGAKSIGGWYTATSFYPVVFDTFNMIFYESSHNLVADDKFETSGGGLLLFSGGNYFSLAPIGGGNNTVWGNHFFERNDTPSGVALENNVFGLGIEIAEPNDTVYDNYVATPTTAWNLPIDLYTGYPATFVTSWNIAKQPATVVHYAPGFPLEPLTGSVIDTSYQGGNYWWDYGVAYNPYNGANDPYGLLPYEERATTLLVDIYGPAYYHATYIYPGGDYVPLTNVTKLYAFDVRTTGLPSGLDWDVEVATESAEYLSYFSTGSAAARTAELPNGSYEALVIAPFGWVIGATHSELAFYYFTINGASVILSLKFEMAKGFSKLTFHESGLAKGTNWSVSISSSAYYGFNATEWTTAASLTFSVYKFVGPYNYSVAPVAGYHAAPSSGQATAGSVKVKFTPVTYAVTFTETGLSPGTVWKVTIDHKTISSDTSTIVFDLANGTYSFTVHAPKHTTATPATGSVAVAGAAVSKGISFSG